MLLTAMLAMNTATAMPVDDKDMGVGVALTFPAYSVTVKKWGTLDMLPGIMEDGPGGVAAYVGIRPGGYGLSVHARVNLEKDFWTPPFELGFADMAVYYGVGANVDFTLGYYRNLAVGVGGVVGWQFALNSFPLEVSVQFEPGLNINVIRSYYSLIQFRYYSGLVARYYF
jgi:hypothetical protein